MAQKFIPKSNSPPVALTLFEVPDWLSEFWGNVQGFNSMFLEAEEQAAISLTEHQKGYIRFHIKAFMGVNLQVGQAQSSTNVRKSLEKLHKGICKTDDAIAELSKMEDGGTDITPVLSLNGFPAKNFEEFQKLRDQLDNAVLATLATIQNHSVGKPSGQLGYPGLTFLIQRLSEVFEDAGGNPSAWYSENRRSAKGNQQARATPFVRFCWAFLAALPEQIARPANIGAFAEYVRRAIQADNIE